MTTEEQTTDEPLLLHISAASERLGLSQYQTRNLVKAGELAATTIANRTYIAASAVAEYVDRVRQSA